MSHTCIHRVNDKRAFLNTCLLALNYSTKQGTGLENSALVLTILQKEKSPRTGKRNKNTDLEKNFLLSHEQFLSIFNKKKQSFGLFKNFFLKVNVFVHD